MSLRKGFFYKGINVALFFLISTQCFAIQYNVSNGDQLHSALLSAGSDSTNSYHDIRLLGRVAGVPTRFKRTPEAVDGGYMFTLSVNSTNTQNQEIVIRGGWDNSFSTQGQNPGDSIVDGESISALLSISVRTNAAPNITLKNLVFQSGFMPSGKQTGIVDVSVFGTNTSPFIWLDRIIIKNNDSQNDLFGSAINISAINNASPTIVLTNSQLLDNTSLNDPALFILSSGGLSKFYMLNNTVIGNTVATLNSATGLGVSSPTISADELYVYNNIITSTAQADVFVDNNQSFGMSASYHNHIGLISGAFATTVRQTSGIAKLAFTASPTYHWYPKSCFLINSGTPWPAPFNILSPASLDLLGAPRVRGSGVDRGAVELDMTDFIFCSDFEAN